MSAFTAAQASAKAHEPNILVLTKANTRSTVHRIAHLDYVGVKQYDGSGQVVGERRFLGLYASTAYTESVTRVPLVAENGDPQSDSVRGLMRPTPQLERCPYLMQVMATIYSEQQLELVAPMMRSIFFSPIWVVVSSVVGSIFQSCFFGLFISGLTRRNPDIFSERGNGDA